MLGFSQIIGNVAGDAVFVKISTWPKKRDFFEFVDAFTRPREPALLDEAAWSRMLCQNRSMSPFPCAKITNPRLLRCHRAMTSSIQAAVLVQARNCSLVGDQKC